MPMIDPLYSLSGFAVGMLVGMTGVGGGSLMTPILILLFGIHPATAVGTDLLYAAATKTGGSLVHGLARSIDWRVVRRLASGSVPATIATLAVLSHFNLNGEAARDLITLVLSVALFATAFVLVFGGPLVAIYRARVSELDPQAHGRHHGAGRRAARRAGLDLLGRRRRHRRGDAGAALSASADSQDHRIRYRTCGAAHADRRARPLDDGLGRLAHHRLAAGRLAAGHFRRQLFRHSHSRSAPCGWCWRRRCSSWRAASLTITPPRPRRCSPPSHGALPLKARRAA